jgi:hypothetical protein
MTSKLSTPNFGSESSTDEVARRNEIIDRVVPEAVMPRSMSIGAWGAACRFCAMDKLFGLGRKKSARC